MMPMTPWVRRLLITNVVLFLVAQPGTSLFYVFTLVPFAALQRPWTLVTYMFLHAGFGHVFFNMLGLYFFGPRLEDRLGGRTFLWLYFLSGLGGAVFSFFFAPRYPVVGASGAVFGILLGFAMYWPRERIYLWMILPVEAWLLAVLLVAGSLWMGVSGSASRTAHFAHLGGLVFAFVFLKWSEWHRGKDRRAFQKAMAPPSNGLSDRAAAARWKAIDLGALHQINREEVERLLAKVEADGARSLTASERQFLDRMARS
ncbi:MAG TPA: rhomboid family intramembrane serine protease [Longimicrobiales bacterium]|nr:rhomboid family intramembrane serine protease [Longimicrobiales bacterium]